MALAEQTEFAFMKAAKGTDVPKAEVVELHQDVARYKKMFPKLTSDEILTILRELMPAKAQMNAKGGVIKAQRGTDVVRAKDQIIDIKTEEDQIQALIDHSDGVLSREEALFFLRDIKKEYGLQDGGLLDQGGSKDPVSGNDVPIGSLKEEVRDDIPAMLSEGEFVFPADVTRYYGLDTLMKMRQKAKQGLKVMEAMGQMGNSEEAIIPDDIPFDMDDLELAEGGVVKAQQGIYVPPNINTPTTGQTSYGTAPTLFPMNQTATTMPVEPFPEPVLPPPAPIKTFDDLLGSAGYDELRTYVNDAGQQMQIPFKGGKPISAIPEGYRPRKESDDAMGVPQVNYRQATDTAQSSSSRGTAPQTMEQQKVADDLLLGTEEDASKGKTSAVTGVQPKSAEAFEVQDFKNYLKVKSPMGTDGVDYAGTGAFKLDDSTGFTGKAGDFIDAGVGRIPILGGIQRMGDRAIRKEAVSRIKAGEYADGEEYNILRNIIDLEPRKAGKLSLIQAADGKELTDDIKEIQTSSIHKYSPDKAKVHRENKEKFKTALRAEKEKRGAVYKKNERTGKFEEVRSPTTQTEMTRMMITQDPTRESKIMMGESNSEREARERKEADAMRRAANIDAFQNRQDERSADAASDTNFSQSTASGSGGETAGTHCCTASYKQKTMTISEVKELRRWHRQQSQIWQDGYDVWGKYVADGLVAKSKWQASVVKSVHQLIIKKKLTLKGLYGIILISSGVYPIGLFKRVMRYGRIFQST